MAVCDPSGRIGGIVTSGTFSPTLGAGIALAILTGAEQDDEVNIDVRGRSVAATVVRPPFVNASPR
jgi:aminomethyltransferase